MVCVGCQKRREAIAKMAQQVGTIVFGGRGRKLANFSENDGKKSRAAGLDQAAADAGTIAGATGSATDDHAGAAGKSATGGGSHGGGR